MSFKPSSVDVEHFLEVLEVRNLQKATEQEMKFSCPLPQHEGDDNSPSCYMNVNTSLFFCHTCHQKGNAIHFAAECLGITELEAIRMLKQAYSPNGINIDARPLVEEVKKLLQPQIDALVEQPILDESLVDRYEVSWEEAYYHYINGGGHESLNYMFERGFSPYALNAWRIGWDEYTRRIMIPVRDVDGHLIGFKGRSSDPKIQPKYLVMGGKEWPRYFPSRVVFGAYKIPAGSTVVLCEGELNVISLWDKLAQPAVAINGSHFTEYHAKIIRNIASKVILFLDEDQAGNEATWGRTDQAGNYKPGIIYRLRPYMPVYVVPTHNDDAADLEEEELKPLIDEAKPALIAALDSGKLFTNHTK